MEDNNCEYLLAAAAWQDSLLQSYRSLHITIQSILLAMSAGLFVAVISLTGLLSSITAFLVLIVMWIFQSFTTQRFKNIITARGEDVNFWHREIILAEQQIEIQQRYFTKFKVYQKLHRQDAEYLQDMFLSSKKAGTKDVEILIEKGLGHTRYAIDEQLFQRISWIWSAFVLSSLAFVAFRLYQQFPH